MANKRISEVYVDRAFALFGEGKTVAEAYRIIEEEVTGLRPSDVVYPKGPYPNRKTFYDRHKEYLALSGDQQRDFAYFHWPRSVLNGAVPREASRTALELLAWRLRERSGRPNNRLTRWYCELHAIAPDLPMEFLLERAADYAAWERDGTNLAPEPRWIESFLAFRPWESESALHAYREAFRREDDPIPRPPIGRSMEFADLVERYGESYARRMLPNESGRVKLVSFSGTLPEMLEPADPHTSADIWWDYDEDTGDGGDS
jgi:hypothetical protein